MTTDTAPAGETQPDAAAPRWVAPLSTVTRAGVAELTAVGAEPGNDGNGATTRMVS